MSHSVKSHLGVNPADYDHAIRRFIPGYEQMVDAVVAELTHASPALVLDLGAGTGALAERLLASDPLVTVELWDVDRAMLDAAARRLRPFGPRARFVQRSFATDLPRCDAVMASLALHHVATLGEKTALYARISRALGPAGRFVNGDAMFDTRVAGRPVYRAWADHMIRSGIPEAEAWRHFDAWAREDHYFPVEDEVAALAAAGLTARVAWSEGPIAVIVAEPERR